MSALRTAGMASVATSGRARQPASRTTAPAPDVATNSHSHPHHRPRQRGASDGSDAPPPPPMGWGYGPGMGMGMHPMQSMHSMHHMQGMPMALQPMAMQPVPGMVMGGYGQWYPTAQPGHPPPATPPSGPPPHWDGAAQVKTAVDAFITAAGGGEEEASETAGEGKRPIVVRADVGDASYWVAISPLASCEELKRAVEAVSFSHGRAFACHALRDATGCFLPGSLKVGTVLQARASVTALSAAEAGIDGEKEDSRSALRSLFLHFDACKRLAARVLASSDHVAGLEGADLQQAISMVLAFLSCGDRVLGMAAVVAAARLAPASPPFCASLVAGGGVVPMCALATTLHKASTSSSSGSEESDEAGEGEAGDGGSSSSHLAQLQRVVIVLSSLLRQGAVPAGSMAAGVIAQTLVLLAKGPDSELSNACLGALALARSVLSGRAGEAGAADGSDTSRARAAAAATAAAAHEAAAARLIVPKTPQQKAKWLTELLDSSEHTLQSFAAVSLAKLPQREAVVAAMRRAGSVAVMARPGGLLEKLQHGLVSTAARTVHGQAARAVLQLVHDSGDEAGEGKSGSGEGSGATSAAPGGEEVDAVATLKAVLRLLSFMAEDPTSVLVLDNARVVEWFIFIAAAAPAQALAVERCLCRLFANPASSVPQPSLVLPLASSANDSTAAVAATVLAAFSARDGDNLLGRHVGALAELASSQVPKIRLPAVLALGHVSLKHRNKRAVVEHGGIPLFALLLTGRPSVEIVEEEELKEVAIAGSGDEDTEAEPDTRLQRIAAKALANLATASEAVGSRVRRAVMAVCPGWEQLAAADSVMGIYLPMAMEQDQGDSVGPR